MSFGTNGKFALLWLNKLLFSKHISIQNTPLTFVRTKTKSTAVHAYYLGFSNNSKSV